MTILKQLTSVCVVAQNVWADILCSASSARRTVVVSLNKAIKLQLSSCVHTPPTVYSKPTSVISRHCPLRSLPSSHAVSLSRSLLSSDEINGWLMQSFQIKILIIFRCSLLAPSCVCTCVYQTLRLSAQYSFTLPVRHVWQFTVWKQNLNLWLE